MHSSRTRTVRSLPYRGSLSGGFLSRRSPSGGGGLCPGGLCPGGPQKEHDTRDKTPRRNMGPETETPQKEHGTRQPDRRWHYTETPFLPVNRMSHTSKNIRLQAQERIQDYPVGGGVNPPGCANIQICQIFPKNCMKLRKFLSVRGGGWGAPLNPPMGQ